MSEFLNKNAGKLSLSALVLAIAGIGYTYYATRSVSSGGGWSDDGYCHQYAGTTCVQEPAYPVPGTNGYCFDPWLINKCP